MNLPVTLRLFALPGLLLLAQPVHASEAGLAFFESKIRPVLVEHCYKCHSAEGKSPKGGLRVDSRAALLAGGDSGPALVPGKPAQSLLLRALRHEDELKMPPKGKLSPAILADFEKWVSLGAPDPRVADRPGQATIDQKVASKHWAFQPIRRTVPPRVSDPQRARTPIDQFLLARLQQRGLSFSVEADRRTLLRRLTFDLIGLPPTPEEVDAFLADTRPDAYERIVERLLASPQHGERWARHWLDVARFADTKDGVLQYGDDRVRPYAYTYRDWAIRAFNADLGFDRAIHEQLAADLLPDADPSALAALGFLTLGRQFDNNVHDILDDRIDTVTRGLLGVTVACARCHDHKYDPIPTADYYSLYGVFASSETPVELPLLGQALTPAQASFEKQLASRQQDLRTFLETQHARLLETTRQRIPDYLVRVTQAPDPLENAIFFLSLAPEDLRPQILSRWRRLIERRTRPDDPVFGPWHDLMQVPESALASELPRLRSRWGQNINPLVRAALERARIASRADLARVYGELLRSTYERSKTSALGRAEEQLVALVVSRDSPAYFPLGRTRDFMSRSEKDAFGGKQQELDRLAVRSADAPPRAMALVDTEPVFDPFIFVRGDASRPGTPVPRRFLAVVSGEKRQPFGAGSGRLDLARAITAPDNPLTARVLVNRVWMHHFGEPLVENPSDLGLRTAPPSHPELLDWLARDLMEHGWSLKHLHRLIVLSSAYRQTSAEHGEGTSRDPENRLLWRMHRHRLDLESMRDTLLALSGRLDTRLHGKPVDVAGNPAEGRRTVYGLVDRQSLPGLFRAFDFASPDQSAERRPQTTVAQQALFGLNAPFVLTQARALAARVTGDPTSSPEARVDRLYRIVLTRLPTQEERALALGFVRAGSTSRLGVWEQLAQVLLQTNELQFVD